MTGFGHGTPLKTNMSIIISFFIGVVAGALGGILAYRNNLSKAQSVEAKGKSILDALKGK